MDARSALKLRRFMTTGPCLSLAKVFWPLSPDSRLSALSLCVQDPVGQSVCHPGLSCSKGDRWPGGCHSRMSPAGGAGRACLREGRAPWPSHSPGLGWAQGSLPPHSASGRYGYSAPEKTYNGKEKELQKWEILFSFFNNVFMDICI